MEEYNITYIATAGADKVISKCPSVLYGIIIGKDVASSVVEVSNSPSDGDGDVKVYLAGSTLMTSCGGFVKVNAIFKTGIAADLTEQTNVAFIWKPTAA